MIAAQDARSARPAHGKGEIASRSTRSLRRRDFERVLRAGRRGACGAITVHSLARARPDDVTRIGLIVRASGAVTRNRIKRRLRAASALLPREGYDVALRGGEALYGQDFQVIEKWMAEAGRRAGLEGVEGR